MDSHVHPLHELFAQLGLPAGPAAIDQFIRRHTPLPGTVQLADAPWWTPAQATFLREQFVADSDWAEVIDQLNLALRGD